MQVRRTDTRPSASESLLVERTFHSDERTPMTDTTTQRELAHRAHDGLEVTLLWDPRSNTVSIDVVDDRNECSFSRRIPQDCALDAFHHPYVYAPAWMVVSAPRGRASAVAEG
jgi:hypothetical protein